MYRPCITNGRVHSRFGLFGVFTDNPGVQNEDINPI